VRPRANLDRQTLGRRAEECAARLLEKHGARILCRNFRRRTGELDLIAEYERTLLIVEVRLRSRADFGGAAASIDSRKRLRILRTTQQLLQSHPALARLPARFDVITVDGSVEPWRLEWIRHAFTAGY
jgi:putative endonuclease